MVTSDTVFLSELLKHLREMTADLPEEIKNTFLINENRLKLELLIEALEGKTTLFRKMEQILEK